ncbi:MAG: hypothetical protein JXQ71_12850 [Verrucomicrobia bacterium]|nr:hypothetical protein [Verrucomicrobiota bacterium]
MASLFIEPGPGQAPGWLGRHLVSPRINLLPADPIPLRACAASDPPDAGAVATLLCLGGAGIRQRWALCMRQPGGLHLNGQPVFLGQMPLRHRDEIVLPGGRRMFFSTERPAVITPFPGADQPVSCPRCRREIEPGQPAVCCPGCGVWSHQIPGYLPCYAYEDTKTCPACPHPNNLDGSLTWSPEDI